MSGFLGIFGQGIEAVAQHGLDVIAGVDAVSYGDRVISVLGGGILVLA